tara:strand:+ start:178 stop:630 length:453 start_codon:yes stop_codon:yes gene_type:complete
MKYWSGTNIKPEQINGTNKIFVFGSNPQGRHGLGAAKSAMAMGAVYGKGRGHYGNTYALVTKNISKTLPYVCEDNYVYNKAGKCSVSLEAIRHNLMELCKYAKENPKLDFFLVYQNTNKTLNGYSPRQIIALLQVFNYVPDNLFIHNSFR